MQQSAQKKIKDTAFEIWKNITSQGCAPQNTIYQSNWDKEIYKLNRLLEEKEAVLFVCGDAKNMAKDVNSMLVKIVANHGKIKESEAREYVAKLRLEKRYLEDIWT